MNGALIRDEDMDDVIGMILPDVRALLLFQFLQRLTVRVSARLSYF